MALWPPRQAEPQDKVCCPPERLRSSSQPLAAYYASFSGYGHYTRAFAAAEDDVQPFRQLGVAMSSAQAVTPFPFPMAPAGLSPGLTLQREPLYEVPWHKLSPWYPVPHLPGEMPHFLDSHEYTGASGQNLVPVGGHSNGAQYCEPDTCIPRLRVDASPSPEGPKTFQLVCRSPRKRYEDGPTPLNQEGKSPQPLPPLPPRPPPPPPSPPPRFHFTEEDLRFVLYGVTPSPEHPASLHYAISGLLVPADSSGSNHLPQTLDKDSLQLPEGLCLLQMQFGEVPHLGVFCSSFIAKGIRFGPFQGKVVNASEVKTHRDNSLMWEIFEDGHLSHFVDGKGTGNWMSYVNCARFPKEQNLVAVQCQGQIFYESCKEIQRNQELLVWYGDCYEKFLDLPVSLQITEQGKPQSGPSEESAEGYRCERCGKVFSYKYYRDKHLKYTPCVDQGDRKFPCSLCKRSFEKRDRLRIHILHVHEKHRPHQCSICGKRFSQSSSLNKHMRVHSGDRPYQCVYCTKKFTASSILRTHIRQHSGEKPFKCKFCGKAFASHAAHDSHVRRSHRDGDQAAPVQRQELPRAEEGLPWL